MVVYSPRRAVFFLPKIGIVAHPRGNNFNNAHAFRRLAVRRHARFGFSLFIFRRDRTVVFIYFGRTFSRAYDAILMTSIRAQVANEIALRLDTSPNETK